MKRLSTSLRILAGLIILYAILAAISVFLPMPSNIPGGNALPASKPVVALANFFMVLILYGGMGYGGYYFSGKIGFPEIWNRTITNWKRFGIPALYGLGIGIFLILSDLFFSRYNTIGRLPHPPFPMSIIASATAGIGEEVLFRLFFISFWVWLISFIILKGKKQNTVFLIVSLLSALVFAIAHLPAFMFLNGWKTFGEIPPVLLGELILLNGVVALFAAWNFRKYGILAAIGIHFWTDIVWHFCWGMV